MFLLVELSNQEYPALPETYTIPAQLQNIWHFLMELDFHSD
jgi:hypothetical protein